MSEKVGKMKPMQNTLSWEIRFINWASKNHRNTDHIPILEDAVLRSIYRDLKIENSVHLITERGGGWAKFKVLLMTFELKIDDRVWLSGTRNFSKTVSD